MKIFLDMDGVCADFVLACEEYFDIRAEPIWDFFLKWGMTAKGFWEEIEQDDCFWANIVPTDQFFDLVAIVERFDPEFKVLTTPTNQHSCYWGKHEWCDKYFDFENVSKRLMYAYDKSLCSGPDRILIDDRPENITEWESAGGVGILWPAPYNKNAGKDGIKIVKDELDKLQVLV